MPSEQPLPWYRTARRWGQTNLVEIDPLRYDPAWWRAHWRRTRVQGVIVNAGGIVAYYPSRFPLHQRADTLGERDLYGEIVAQAREDGLRVIARMDSNRVSDAFREAHPDWMCVDGGGAPYRLADKFVTCINSAYYTDYLPGVMTEIIERSRPDGFSDNSWAGLPREKICHCRNCRDGFAAETGGLALPDAADWTKEAYRRWVAWNYRRRTEVWELNNRVTQAAGGPDCVWSGMISGDVLNNCNRFIDLREILRRTPIVMLDHQRRSPLDGFEQNTEAGKRLHGLAGWDTPIPESMPQYQLGAPAFRLAAMPAAEVRLWSSAAFAGGIQPWWHHIGSAHEDRRQYATAEPIFRWHEANEDVLFDRRPVADVGVVWSQLNHDAAGRDRAQERTMHPYRGAVKALNRAGLTFLPVHADDIGASVGRVGALLLPNVAVLTDEQARAVRAFAAAGGGVVATGDTGLLNENGAERADYALGELFGVHRRPGTQPGTLGDIGPADLNIENSSRHTFLRLRPELSPVGYKEGVAPPVVGGGRHAVLAGLEDTDIVPFGGLLPDIAVEADVAVLATFVPDFPIFPPETSWMRRPRTEQPALCVRDRLVWVAADLDRCLARDDHPEHALLLANAVRAALGRAPTVELAGAHGCVSASLYEQEGRWVLHLHNDALTSRVPGRQDRFLPIGPVSVRLRVPAGAGAPGTVELRVAGTRTAATAADGFVVFEVAQIMDHEVAVVGWGGS